MSKLYKKNAARAIVVLTSSGLPSTLQNPAFLFNEVLRSSTDGNGNLLPGTWMADMTERARGALRSAAEYMSEHLWESQAKQLSLRTLIKRIIEAPQDDFLDEYAYAYVATFQEMRGLMPHLNYPGERHVVSVGGFVALRGGEWSVITAAQEQATRVMKSFADRCPQGGMVINPLVDVARDDAKGVERFGSAGERAAWLAEAEGVSRRLWHMAPAATPACLLAELMMQDDHGASDLVTLERLDVLPPKAGQAGGTSAMPTPQPQPYSLTL